MMAAKVFFFFIYVLHLYEVFLHVRLSIQGTLILTTFVEIPFGV